jgi:3-methylcrotonyl-CoA carboxylase alpha subunit
MELAYRIGSRHITVTVRRGGDGQFALMVDGHERNVDATLLDPTTVRLSVDGMPHTAFVARVGTVYHVIVAGELYVLNAESGAARHHAPLAPPRIVAPMPGKVLAVLVRAGQEIASGAGLLILEAMKMEHRILAEAPARVRAVHVSDGQMVDAGAVLVELDYADTAG